MFYNTKAHKITLDIKHLIPHNNSMPNLTSLFNGKPFTVTNPTPTDDHDHDHDHDHTVVIANNPKKPAPLPDYLKDLSDIRNDVPRSPRGRPKKYRGKGWDELTPEEYRKKARVVSALEGMQITTPKGRFGKRKFELPASQFFETRQPMPDWGEEVLAAYEVYKRSDMEYQKVVNDFVQYMNTRWVEVLEARTNYLTMVAAIASPYNPVLFPQHSISDSDSES